MTAKCRRAMCNALKGRQTQLLILLYSFYLSLSLPLNGASLNICLATKPPWQSLATLQMSTLSTNAGAGLGSTELRCIGSWSEHTNPEYYSAHTVLPTPHNGPASPHQGHGRIVLREREKQEALAHKEDFCKQLEPAHGEHRQCDDIAE